jgi:glycosyltransferase involved in cell wall biosynthesis
MAAPPLAGARIAVDGRYTRRPGMGIHQYLLQIVRLLQGAGADLTLLINFPEEEVAGSGAFDGVRLRSFGSATNLRWEQWDVPRLLRRREYDLYWAPANTGIPFLPTGGTPRLFTLHDLIPLRLPRMYLTRSALYTGPYVIWTAAGLTRSTRILTVSHASARDLRRLTGRRAVVAPPLWFDDLLPPRDTPAGTVPPALEGRRYVLYNGGLDPRKNVPVLVRACAMAAAEDPDLHFAFMGRGYEEHIGGLLDTLRLRDRAVLTGYVSEEDKLAILRGASALVYPSLYEGFGLPLLEAFSQGVPVVTAGNSSLGEVAGDAALIVDPGDARSIADGMLAVQDPATAADLRARGDARWAAYDAGAVARDVVATVAATLRRR